MAAILVIKLSALGDVLMAAGCFQAIREHHPGDQIVLLTTKPFAELTRRSGYFDMVAVDSRPKLWHIGRWRQLLKLLNGFHFTRVYDLQRNQRTSVLYRLLRWSRRDLEWSGVVPGCSHFVPARREEARHMVDKLTEQLAAAGIAEVPEPDLSWLGGGALASGMPQSFALMVPGAAPTRPEKMAPPALYAKVARSLMARGITPVLIGRSAEAATLATIAASCPGSINLCDRTSFDDIADLSRLAVGAIGNDTGPMHLVGLAGCPTVTLFSQASDPARIGPRGRDALVLRRDDWSQLTPEEVFAAFITVMREGRAAAREAG